MQNCWQDGKPLMFSQWGKFSASEETSTALDRVYYRICPKTLQNFQKIFSPQKTKVDRQSDKRTSQIHTRNSPDKRSFEDE